MSHWVRLWGDMPTDPKWRVIARRAKRPISEVISVFNFMMVNAGSATVRGTLENWNDEDVAAALDVEPEDISGIRDAMQGKLLDGDRLTGWERRQPKREDNAAERARAWREEQKRLEIEAERKRTQANASERPDKIRTDTDKNREEETAVAVSTEAAPEKVSKEEIERRCEQAAGFGEMSGIGKLAALVLSESDLESRILPIVRDAAKGLRASGRKPENWIYFVKAVSDPDRKVTSPPAQPLALVPTGYYAAAGSKQLEAWQEHTRATSGKSSPTDSRGGWRFPTEWPAAERKTA